METTEKYEKTVEARTGKIPLQRLVRLYIGHCYATKKDYGELFLLAQHTPIICFVGESGSTRIDVASTISAYGSVSISTPGICYVTADTKDEFIRQCKHSNVEYLSPTWQEA